MNRNNHSGVTGVYPRKYGVYVQYPHPTIVGELAPLEWFGYTAYGGVGNAIAAATERRREVQKLLGFVNLVSTNDAAVTASSNVEHGGDTNNNGNDPNEVASEEGDDQEDIDDDDKPIAAVFKKPRIDVTTSSSPAPSGQSTIDRFFGPKLH